MTYEEALKILEPIIFETDDEGLALMEAKEALEKQIPRKQKEQMQYCGKCDCGHYIFEDMNYCPNCGQRIDWGEEK